MEGRCSSGKKKKKEYSQRWKESKSSVHYKEEKNLVHKHENLSDSWVKAIPKIWWMHQANTPLKVIQLDLQLSDFKFKGYSQKNCEYLYSFAHIQVNI